MKRKQKPLTFWELLEFISYNLELSFKNKLYLSAHFKYVVAASTERPIYPDSLWRKIGKYVQWECLHLFLCNFYFVLFISSLSCTAAVPYTISFLGIPGTIPNLIPCFPIKKLEIRRWGDHPILNMLQWPWSSQSPKARWGGLPQQFKPSCPRRCRWVDWYQIAPRNLKG